MRRPSTKPNEPLRVVHVISGLHLGGAETLLYRLAARSSNRIAHEVICLGDRQWYSSRLEELGVRIHHLRMTAVNFPLAAAQLRKLVRQSNADVVQSWLYVANVLSGIFARPAGVPVVWGIHASTLEHVGPISRFCALFGGRASRRLADFVINCSSRSAELHARMGYNAVPNAVIYNGYDPDFFFPDEDTRTACRCALGIPDATFAIGSAGRWHAQKDIPNLLRATKLLRDRGVPVVCLLVGGGLDEGNAELNAEIRSAGCDGDVIALGAQANVHDYYRAMDLHVLASSGSEAFPNVVAESMLCGTPNAVTDVGDSALIVGDTGWVMPPRDAVKLADAIEQARQERSGQAAEWKERRDSARKRIVEHFTFERMANAYEDVWRQVARDWKSARWSGR